MYIVRKKLWNEKKYDVKNERDTHKYSRRSLANILKNSRC